MNALAEPGLSLDKRQRAMLKEMGVQVWQPLPIAIAPVALVAPVASVASVATTAATKPVAPKPVVDAAPVAINSEAASAHYKRAVGTFDSQKQPPEAQSTASSAWRIGKLQTLYFETAVAQAGRWLVLTESPASALQEGFNPFDGDAGKLLDNMLRAARLHTAGATMLAPLVRGQGTGGNLNAELAYTFAAAKANVVLVMGRLAAQALLQSTEPLAKLRGQTHNLHSTKTIITIDPAYLLRNPLDKAKAWGDLCLGLSMVKSS